MRFGLILCPGTSLDLLPEDIYRHAMAQGIVISCSKVYQTKWKAHWTVLVDDYGPGHLNQSHAQVCYVPWLLIERHWEHSGKNLVALPTIDRLGYNLSLVAALKLALGWHDGSFQMPLQDVINPNTRVIRNPVKLWALFGADGGPKPGCPQTVHYAEGISQPRAPKSMRNENIERWMSDFGQLMACTRDTKIVNMSPWSRYQCFGKMSMEMLRKCVGLKVT